MLYNAGVKRKAEADAEKESSAKKADPGPNNAREEPQTSEIKGPEPETNASSETIPEKQATEDHPTTNEAEDRGRTVEFTRKDGTKRTVHFKKLSSKTEHGPSRDKPADATEGGSVQRSDGSEGAESGSQGAPSAETAGSGDGSGPAPAPVTE